MKCSNLLLMAFFLTIFVSFVQTLSQPIALVTTTDQAVELAYDDGVSDTGWYKTAAGVGGYMAVLFSPASDSCRIVSVRYYVEDKPAGFNVLVLDSNREILYDEPVLPKAKGWFDVDLSSAHLTVNGEFYVAMKWTAAEKPSLGADETKGDGRSYFVTEGAWKTYREINLAVNEANKDGDFMIRASVVQLISMTFDVEPRKLGMRVDDSSYRGDELPKTIQWESGSQHTLAVEQLIEGDLGVRYIFVEWSDGSKDVSRTITASQTASYTAKFKVQYQLVVVSETGDPQGTGWYDAGSQVTVSVSSPQPEAGLMGSLGGKLVFQRWSGDLTANTASATIMMDGPKNVRAEWASDNSQAYMILGGIVGAVVVVLLVVLVMRRRGAPQPEAAQRAVVPLVAPQPARPAPEHPARTLQPPPAGLKYCVHCGAAIPSVVMFCTKCGKKQ